MQNNHFVLWTELSLKVFVATLTIAGFLSCAHKPTSPTEPLQGRSTLIPYGVHRQRVNVLVRKTPESAERTMTFSGVMNHRRDFTQLIGLTPFGSTLFRLKDNPATGELTFETDNAQMKKAEPYLKSTYQPLRELLKIPYPPRQEQVSRGDFTFEFRDYDAQDVPQIILIHSDRFELTIDQESYEP